MLLNDGATLERSKERIRHGNDAKLIVGELVISDQPRSDPQLIIPLKDAHRARTLAMAKPNFALDRLAKTFGRSTERPLKTRISHQRGKRLESQLVETTQLSLPAVGHLHRNYLSEIRQKTQGMKIKKPMLSVT
ncbi:MAG: hypothetical protein LH610_12610 [Sphingomonas bacterium]|nr:hypothetical protein [Sphingomonas bacterium]